MRAVDLGPNRLQQGRTLGFGEGAEALLVGANDLLLAGDEAGLADGRARVGGDAVRLDPGLACQQLAQAGAGRVLSDQAHEHGFAAQGGDVVGHIAGAAEHLLGPAQPDDRHWSFRGDPFDVAVDITVEHHVADAQDADAGKVHRSSLDAILNWGSNMGGEADRGLHK